MCPGRGGPVIGSAEGVARQDLVESVLVTRGMGGAQFAFVQLCLVFIDKGSVLMGEALTIIGSSCCNINAIISNVTALLKEQFSIQVNGTKH